MSNKKHIKNRSVFALFIFTVILLLFVNGCNRTNTEESSIIEIRERMFLTQVNDIYLNSSSFLGKTIKLEGIFQEYTWDNRLFYFVLRNSPGGCCGNDGRAGFEIRWPENNVRAFPENNSWVEVMGILRVTPDRLLYLELLSLRVSDTRGLEFVYR